MKHGGKIAVGLAGALVLPVGLRAVTPDSPGNPYQPIVERNVFGLKPPPPPPEVKPPDVPAPKITLQGIVSTLGTRYVLFKTLMPGSKPGEAPKETSLTLAEGQRAGEIEVLEINEVAGAVKFRNHGMEQPLTLEKDSVKPPSSSAPGVPMAQPGVPGVPVPGVPAPATANFNPVPTAAMANAITTFGNATRGTVPSRTLRVSSAGGVGLGGSSPSISGGNGVPPTQARVLTPEEQIALMEVNREIHKNNPDMPPLPPTGFVPQ